MSRSMRSNSCRVRGMLNLCREPVWGIATRGVIRVRRIVMNYVAYERTIC